LPEPSKSRGGAQVARRKSWHRRVIRFPELTAQRRESDAGPGIDAVTAYFLVGSFASGLMALTGLALAL
jgi:hypothetical protein